MLKESAGLEEELKARALRLGFSLFGIASPGPAESYERYIRWLDEGKHGGMAYLDSAYHRQTRSDPALLYPGLQSIIVLGYPYHLTSESAAGGEWVGRISGYAACEDYHSRLPDLLKPLCDMLVNAFPESPQPRVFTDSAPILERELAVRAGLGWIGRNSCVISPREGSGFLLTEIFTAMPLRTNPPYPEDHCGSCTRCLDACPTGCIQEDRTIDAARCISYLTIENKGEILAGQGGKVGEWVFGCDLCQTVCPWNRKVMTRVDDGQTLSGFSVEKMLRVLRFTKDDFDHRFSSSAIKRAKLNGLKRNILVWMGNHRMREAVEIIEEILQTEEDPMVSTTARDVLKQLADI